MTKRLGLLIVAILMGVMARGGPSALAQMPPNEQVTVLQSPDHKFFYVAETFYARGTQGDRTDVLTVYDATHLSRIGEIPITSKRQLALADPSSMGVTPDGRFVLMLNLTPATSVTAVDLEGKKVAGEIQTPGCSEILMLGDREFASVCADGSMLTTKFDDSAKATEQKRTAKPFFDVEKDPVFQLPA